MVPPAPTTFSTMTCCLRVLLIGAPINLATVSVGPPAAKGTTIVMTLVGYSWALAWDRQKTARQAMTRKTLVITILLLNLKNDSSYPRKHYSIATLYPT